MLNTVNSFLLDILIPLCELIGIIVVAVSTIESFVRYIILLTTGKRSNIKLRLANGLALSLQFKMAAEILKTVVVRDISELLVLGLVIVLRALFALLIHFEIKNHVYDDEDDEK